MMDDKKPQIVCFRIFTIFAVWGRTLFRDACWSSFLMLRINFSHNRQSYNQNKLLKLYSGFRMMSRQFCLWPSLKSCGLHFFAYFMACLARSLSDHMPVNSRQSQKLEM